MVKDASPIQGAIHSTHSFNAYPNDDGNYFVVVSNDSGSVTSRMARLTVIEPVAPFFLIPRATGLGVPPGSSVELSIAVRGREPLFYQWFRTNTILSRETNATLRFSRVDMPDYGEYALMVSNAYGSATASITLFVYNPYPGGTNVITPQRSFAEVIGIYNGLLYETNFVQHDSSGFLTAKVRRSGAFSAHLRNGRHKFSFSGAFNSEGKATNQITRLGMNPLLVEFCLDLHGADQITGIVSDGTWRSQLVADRAGFSREHPALQFATNYTLLIPDGTNGAVEPAGDGVGMVRVKTDGTLSFSGVLADGSPSVTQHVPLSRRGEWLLYLSLYGGKGSLLGWLGISPSAEPNIAGRLNWFRPPTRKPNVYTNGLIVETMTVGSVFTRIGTNCIFDLNTARVVLFDEYLSPVLTNVVALGPNGRATNQDSHQMTLTVKAGSGLFSGKVTLPGPVKAVPFQGTLLQHQGFGSGFFTISNHSGRVYFGP